MRHFDERRGSTRPAVETLAVPTDEVVLGIFGAESAEMAAQTCQRAGHPAVRLTAAEDITGRALAAIGAPITPES